MLTVQYSLWQNASRCDTLIQSGATEIKGLSLFNGIDKYDKLILTQLLSTTLCHKSDVFCKYSNDHKYVSEF